MSNGVGMEVFLELVRAVELLLCIVVAGVLAQRWRRRRSQATGSAFGIFAVVAVVIAAGYFEPGDPTRGWGAVYTDVLISVLLALPYLIVRFTWVLGGMSDRTHRLLGGLVVLEVLVTLAVPALPEEGAPQPRWVTAYVVFVLAAWSLQCTVAAAGLWRAGRGESSVVRHRMRSLSSGGLLLSVTLVLSGVAGGETAAVVQVGLALLGLASIVLFAVAFLPPPVLRLLWRQDDVAALSTSERGLMRALTRDDVAETIVPVVARVFGGGGAALLDEQARPVLSTGLTDAETRRLTDVLAQSPDGRLLITPDTTLLLVHLTQGWLAVRAGRLAPVFGDDEAVLLDRVGTLVDLALQRVQLFEQEQVSRQAAEVANSELETLLYSVSHDLRSPLISVLGYLDVLLQEHRDELTGDGAHYLDRITVNAVYMQSLIADLLELSRIGRSDPPAAALDLQPLAEQVLEAARLAHPRADLQVRGPLPVVRMSDVRARQLLTNLVDNALKHGGRDDLRVVVSAVHDDAGRVQLSVADDGCGVPSEYRDRVLQVFERLESARATTGTGMGLAICKRIVESLGGVLAVGGPAHGFATGATVTAQLPAAVVQPDVPAQREGTSPQASRTLVEGLR